MTDDTPEGPDEAADVIVFAIAAVLYAVESRFVREVHPLADLTAIPCTPDFVLGVINIRGQLCPVLDLTLLLGLPAPGLSNVSRALVLHDRAMEFAIAADGIVGVRSIPRADIETAEARDNPADLLSGHTRDRVALVDAARLLALPALVVNDRVEG